MKVSRFYWVLFFSVYLITAIFNRGFIASDEYWIGIDRYIPAEKASVSHLVHSDDVKSPVQLLPMFLAGQLARQVGIAAPFPQFAFVVFMMGLFASLIYFFGLNLYQRSLSVRDSFEPKKYGLEFLLLIFSFYFLAPFILTRPMFESVAAPLLFVSAIYAYQYDQSLHRKDLLWALIYFTFAFLFRPQVGLSALTLVLLPLFHRRWSDVAWIFVGGFIAILISGIPDYILLGQFHGSLIKLATYNIDHGRDYGRQSPLYFVWLLLGISFSPFFIRQYTRAFLSVQWRRHRAFFLYIFLHTTFPQKFERFIIPVIPIMLLILAPFIYDLYCHRKTNKVRWNSLIFLNGTLFICCTFLAPQKNITDLALFIGRHPQIEKLISFDEALEWIPRAFIGRKEPTLYQVRDTIEFGRLPVDCRSLIVVRSRSSSEGTSVFQNTLRKFNFSLLAEFDVNPIEKLAYWLNPKMNIRRVPLQVYGCH